MWLVQVWEPGVATSRVRIAGSSVDKRGLLRSEEGERAVAFFANLRRRQAVMTVKCQASSLLGRLETLGARWCRSGREERSGCSCGGKLEEGEQGLPAAGVKFGCIHFEIDHIIDLTGSTALLLLPHSLHLC